MPQPLIVDVIQDTVCPWCRIGLAHLRTAIDEWGGPVQVRFHPFFLNPDIPAEGSTWREYLGARFGPETILPMLERVSGAGRDAGLEFNWNGITKYPNTFNSHRLIALSEGERQWPIVDAIEDGYFRDGLDIGNVATLVDLAAANGWDRDEISALMAGEAGTEVVRVESEAAMAGGIGGVPFFMVQGQQALQGAQPAEAFLQVFRDVEAALSRQ